MATGTEIILGFRYTSDLCKRVMKELDVSFDETSNELVMTTAVATLYSDKLKHAHLEACKRVGFYNFKQDGPYIVHVQSPLGARKLAHFRLEMHYDSGEMQEELEQAIFGVSISGRYCPTFVDWKDEHGTIYPIVFDNELNTLISIAHEEISNEFSCFGEALIVAKEKFY